MTMFTVNPPREPIADKRGNITPSWYRFFVQIQQVIGQTNSPIDDTTLSAVPMMQALLGQDDGDMFTPSLIMMQEPDIPPPVYQPLQFDDLMNPPRYGV